MKNAIFFILVFGCVILAKQFFETNDMKEFLDIPKYEKKWTPSYVKTNYAPSAKDYLRNEQNKISNNNNEIILAELRKNREEIQMLKDQIISQENKISKQNKLLKKQKSFQHWQGISRMMNSFNN